MAKRKKKVKATFKPVDFSHYSGGGELNVIIPPELPKKTMQEVVDTIKHELELVRMGVSKNCAMAIQFDDKKTPFCRRLSLVNPNIWTTTDVQDLPRLAAQDFGNKFADFVKDELRRLF